MWFLDQNVVYDAQQNCTKYQNFYSSNGGRYWWQMMPEVLKKFSCPMYGHHWGPKLKNVKKWDFFYTHLWLTTHFVPPIAQIPKNYNQTAITKQWIVWFTQTKHKNLLLNILFTLLDSNNVQKIWKNNKKIHLKKVNSFTFFKLLTLGPNGACTWDRKFFSIPQASSTTNTFFYY